MKAFSDVLSQCELRDLGFENPLFTWYNNREARRRICERLDHYVANLNWLTLFLKAWVSHVIAAYSDHSPIWFDTEGKSVPTNGSKPFRFKCMWLQEHECSNILAEL